MHIASCNHTEYSLAVIYLPQVKSLFQESRGQDRQQHS